MQLHGLTFKQLEEVLSQDYRQYAPYGAMVTVEYKQKEITKIGLTVAKLLLEIPDKWKGLDDIINDSKLTHKVEIEKWVKEDLLYAGLVEQKETNYKRTKIAHESLYTIVPEPKDKPNKHGSTFMYYPAFK